MAHGKVLLIGLDGGTYKILEPFAAEGLIPNLKRLMDEGAKGVLRSTVPPISAPAWATFQTGKNPGGHGLFNFFDLSEDGYRSSHDFRKSRVVNHASIGSATVYDYLREGNRKVISINIPLTYPTPEVDGALVSCWLSPPGSKEYTWPRELADEIPDYRIDQDFGEGMYAITPKGTKIDSNFLMDDLDDILTKRADTTRHLMQSRPWDVCMVCFTETDRLHHYLWRAIDPDHPDADTEEVRTERERFKTFYRNLDAHIGKLIEAAGPDTNLIVMSDHGFDAPPQRRYRMSHWMQEQGWLVTRPDEGDTPGREGTGATGRKKTPNPLGQVGRYLWQRLVPPSLRDQIYARVRYKPTRQVMDWEKTRAWSFGVNNNLGAICINEKQPNGDGCVAPGEETEKLTDEIEQGLRALTHPDTGAPLVREVMRREAVYDGPYLERFPHLIFILDTDFEADFESGFNIASQRIEAGPIYPDGRGNHRPEGIVLAAGPAISPGEKREYGLACIMPTVLRLVGLPVPSDVDGVVMEDYIRPDVLDRDGAGVSEPVEHRFSEPTDEDVAALQDKLKKLGYM
ncbi:MAG: alkaline phosphatase family protein [Leptospirillia bacterium]